MMAFLMIFVLVSAFVARIRLWRMRAVTVLATWMILWLAFTLLAMLGLGLLLMTMLATRMIHIFIFAGLAKLWVIRVEPAAHLTGDVCMMATTVWLRCMRFMVRLSTHRVAVIVAVVAWFLARWFLPFWNRQRHEVLVWPLDAFENAGLEVIDSFAPLGTLAWKTTISFCQRETPG